MNLIFFFNKKKNGLNRPFAEWEKLIALLFDGDKRRWHFAMHSPLINFFSMEPITASANLQTRIEIRSKIPNRPMLDRWLWLKRNSKWRRPIEPAC